MTIKRYWLVSKPHGPTVHRMYARTRVEGNRTRCGIAVQAGWAVWKHGSNRWGDMVGTRCKRCEAVK